jgi:hypothetical protein
MDAADSRASAAIRAAQRAVRFLNREPALSRFARHFDAAREQRAARTGVKPVCPTL